MKVGDLTPSKYNPRKIDPEALENLKKSMVEFGDISGICLNIRTGNLIGGHQRIKNFDPSWKIMADPVTDRTGTVALGHVVTPDGPWAYREVDWPEVKEKAANISANKQRATFDLPTLKELLLEIDTGTLDLTLTGFTALELKDLIDWERETFAPGSITDQQPLDIKKPVKCPECGNEFTP